MLSAWIVPLDWWEWSFQWFTYTSFHSQIQASEKRRKREKSIFGFAAKFTASVLHVVSTSDFVFSSSFWAKRAHRAYTHVCNKNSCVNTDACAYRVFLYTIFCPLRIFKQSVDVQSFSALWCPMNNEHINIWLFDILPSTLYGHTHKINRCLALQIRGE